jgi:hypothetical protein
VVRRREPATLEGVDEIPSSGLIVTWANPLFMLSLRPDVLYQRKSASTAFRLGTHVLPLG